MQDDDEIREVIHRGHEAADLLRNDAFNRLITELKDTYFNRWLSSKDTEEREKIHASALALEDLVNSLMGQVSEGATYEQRLDDENRESREEHWEDWMTDFEEIE